MIDIKTVRKAEEYLLSPLAGIFWLVVFFRNLLFEKGYLKEQKFSVPILSVGNITVGGTGKTPVVALIAEHLKAQGKKVAIVSRGYRGSYKENAVQVDVKKLDAAGVYGDEPVWFAKKCQVSVYVGRRRVDAIELAIEKEKPDIIIADDGFQHRWFQRDQNIVLLDVTETTQFFLPAGRWRESFESLRRATVVLLTKTNLVTQDELSLWEEKVGDLGFYYKKNNLFKVEYYLEPLRRVHGTKLLHDGGTVQLASSIARPESFRVLLENKYNILKHWVMRDHAPWTQVDVDQIEKYGSATDCTHLILTEKDYVKIQNFDFIDLNLWIARLELQFRPDRESFLEAVEIKKPSV
jgi:tetraacyldisaccharide 4'-kinase